MTGSGFGNEEDDREAIAQVVKAHGGRLTSAEDAVLIVEPGHRLMIPIGSQPLAVGDALAAHLTSLEGGGVEMSDCAVAGNFLWLEPGFPGVKKVVHEHWGSPLVRRQVRRHEHDYLPIPFALRFKATGEASRPTSEQRVPDVVLVQVSLPDEAGFVSFGLNAWNQARFVELASFAIAEMSAHVLPSFGDGARVHISAFHAVVLGASGRRLTTIPALNEAQSAIAGYLAEIVNDGDTLQVGAGEVPTACVYAGAFDEKAELGWHSEASVGRIIDLIREGIISGTRKSTDAGLAVATGYAGTDEQIRFASSHPAIHTRPTEYVHNLRVISSQENMVAINAALSLDLTGQIAADSVGTEMIGGTGGQLEFVIGALNARNGRSVTVMESTALGGNVSTIVDVLTAGTIVTVPRQFADIVITEYGIARLWAKSVRERAEALIAIAHPDFRAELRARAFELLG